jgi:hypothetical protein
MSSRRECLVPDPMGRRAPEWRDGRLNPDDLKSATDSEL